MFSLIKHHYSKQLMRCLPHIHVHVFIEMYCKNVCRKLVSKASNKHGQYHKKEVPYEEEYYSIWCKGHISEYPINFTVTHIKFGTISPLSIHIMIMLAEWLSGSVPALPCERLGFVPRIRLREIIPASNCAMRGQNNWGNWGSPSVMKLWVAWEVFRWLVECQGLVSGGFHLK